MNIKVLKENPVYRVSDVVNRRGKRWKGDANTIKTDDTFKGTILREYLLTKKENRDIPLLRNIVQKHCAKYPAPDRNALVAHLRLGDIMDDWGHDGSKRHFSDCKSFYQGIGKHLDKFPKFDKAYIVTAMHFGANDQIGRFFYSPRAYNRSIEIAELFEEKLKERGMKVEFVSNENVDADICFMAGAKYFLGGLTKMSRLVGKCLCDDAQKVIVL